MGSGRTPHVRAAGAVVWRVRSPHGLRGVHGIEVALVHRPRYDDWSLPKGKLENGESSVAAAVREVAEETGSAVALSRRLPTVRYHVGDSRKEVSYWLARHAGGTFAPNEEVDELAWLNLAEAAGRVSYPADRKVLADAARQPVPESVLMLVRHARAGERSAWSGDDCERPLDKGGRVQAQRLAAFLTAFSPGQVVSAPPARCVQTVQPYADSAGLEVRCDSRLGDEGFAADPHAAMSALLQLARPGVTAVVASQGQAIPTALERLWPGHRMADTKKGQAWVLGLVDGEVAFADHYGDAAR